MRADIRYKNTNDFIVTREMIDLIRKDHEAPLYIESEIERHERYAENSTEILARLLTELSFTEAISRKALARILDIDLIQITYYY